MTLMNEAPNQYPDSPVDLGVTQTTGDQSHGGVRGVNPNTPQPGDYGTRGYATEKDMQAEVPEDAPNEVEGDPARFMTQLAPGGVRRAGRFVACRTLPLLSGVQVPILSQRPGRVKAQILLIDQTGQTLCALSNDTAALGSLSASTVNTGNLASFPVLFIQGAINPSPFEWTSQAACYAIALGQNQLWVSVADYYDEVSGL